ncbi:MAG: PhzF family phenazine biosynthesis protein [Pirellulaceae bacterium]
MPASDSLPYYLVDAFTDRLFAGNPAVVCPLPKWPDTAWLQLVAREMNQSETAFLVENRDGFDLRWFTPKVEVDLCGHATLASAFALWHAGMATQGQTIRFSTRSGILTATSRGEEIELDFPLKPEEPAAAPVGLAEALGIEPVYIGRNQFDYLVEISSASVLRQMNPDFARLATVECRGTIVTARSDDPRYDFLSRFFAPQAGINEDPVTGSAHCCLAGFWARRLTKNFLVGYQASPRGGTVRVTLSGERVLLGGRAVLVSRGELLALV